VRLGADSIAFDRLRAEFDRDTLEGNFAYFGPTADHAARIAATLSVSNIDLQRAYALAQHISGDTALALPHEGALSLNVRQALIAGVEAKGADVRLQFDDQALTVERLAIDDFGGARVAAAGSIDIRTLAPRSAITLGLDVNSPDGAAALVEKFSAPAAAALRRQASPLFPARLRGSLGGDAAAARAAGMAAGVTFKIDGSAGALALDLQGIAEMPSDGSLLAAFVQPGPAKFAIGGRIDARDGRALAEAVGLDRLLSVDDRVGRLDFNASGRLGGPMSTTAQLTAGGLDISLAGTLQAAQRQAATADVALTVAQANVRLPQAGTLRTALTARLNYADGVFALSEMTGTVAGSAIVGRLAIGLPPSMSLGGDIKLGAVDVPAVIAAAVGVPAKRAGGGSAWPADPFASGIFGQFNGRIAMASARAVLTPHLIAENLRGVLNFGPSDIGLEDFQADIAGGRTSGRLAFERDGDELALRGRIKLTTADMTTLLPGDPGAISGRLNLDGEIEGRGRSPAALIGSLQGKGFFSIEDGKFARLDPSAIDTVVRSVDRGLPIEAARIRERTEAALVRGALPVEGDGAITAAAGKATLTASRLRAEGADLSVSARYDLVTEALEARFALAGRTGIGDANMGRPEIAVSLQGPIELPRRTLDVAALVDWLSMRAIAENTKRLAAISGRPDARLAEPVQMQPPAPQPAVPPSAVTATKPVAPAEGVKADASAISSNLAKPEPAASAVAVAKPEPAASPVAVAKPEPAAGPVAAAKPEAPTSLPSAAEPAGDVAATKPVSPAATAPVARDTGALAAPGEMNVLRAEPPKDPVIAELDQAIAANPNDGAALARRGQMFAVRGNYGSAIRDFDEVIRLRPNAEAFNNRCWARAIVGELQSALSDCNVALQLSPRYADAFDSRGMINLKSGQLGKAIADYDAALRINPKLASSLYGRGLAKIKTDNAAAGNLDIVEAKAIQANIAEEFASYGIR